MRQAKKPLPTSIGFVFLFVSNFHKICYLKIHYVDRAMTEGEPPSTPLPAAQARGGEPAFTAINPDAFKEGFSVDGLLAYLSRDMLRKRYGSRHVCCAHIGMHALAPACPWPA